DETSDFFIRQALLAARSRAGFSFTLETRGVMETAELPCCCGARAGCKREARASALPAGRLQIRLKPPVGAKAAGTIAGDGGCTRSSLIAGASGFSRWSTPRAGCVRCCGMSLGDRLGAIPEKDRLEEPRGAGTRHWVNKYLSSAKNCATTHAPSARFHENSSF